MQERILINKGLERWQHQGVLQGGEQSAAKVTGKEPMQSTMRLCASAGLTLRIERVKRASLQITHPMRMIQVAAASLNAVRHM